MVLQAIRDYEIKDGDDAILVFKGEFGFLSNFHRAPLTAEGQEYATLEHAFQALKTLDPAAREVIRLKANPHWAKQAARAKSFVVQDGWDDMKVGVMRGLLTQKFTRHPALTANLLATGDRIIGESNTWQDIFWGLCQDEDGIWRGKNVLGTLLMEIRATLAKDKKNGIHNNGNGGRTSPESEAESSKKRVSKEIDYV